MTNFTDNGNQETFENLVCSTSANELHAMWFIAAVNTFLSIAAFLGNFLILVALHKETSLHPPSKLLYTCLATTDLCVGVILQPGFVILLISVIKGGKEFCYHILISSYVLGVIIFGVSLSTLTAISVDRLLALLLRLRYRQVVTLKRSRVVVALLLLLHIFVGTMYFWVHFIFLYYGYVQITICILISGFSYVKIYLTLRRHRAQIRNRGQQGQLYGGWTQPNVAVYRKTVSSSLWIQLTLVACYIPYGIHTALIAKYGLSPSIVLGGRFVSTFVYLNSTLNPFMYCWKIREVRQAVKDTIRQFSCFSS